MVVEEVFGGDEVVGVCVVDFLNARFGEGVADGVGVGEQNGEWVAMRN